MAVPFVPRAINAVRQRWVHRSSNQRWKRLSARAKKINVVQKDQRPVIFFNASTRLIGVSQNAAYSYLTSLGLRAQGVPVVHFACHAGMSRCVLGSDRDRFENLPPCSKCIRQSEALYTAGQVKWFDFDPDEALMDELDNLKFENIPDFTYQGVPLGFWAVNSLRWVMRRHTLKEEIQTRSFLLAYILSAWNVYQQFDRLAEETQPQAVVIFNGMFFPEAAVRQVCLQRGIRAITHEVGIQPYSAFFTDGEATAYPIHIAPEFQLTPEMDQRLDDYLSRRFSGNFTMAGIRFWPEMQKLDDEMVEKIAQYKKVIPVFTNVIFDTSQVHANRIFKDMFQWLDRVYQAIIDHPEVLFVIRAHPDESREGKVSRESVADWVKHHGLLDFPNVVFIAPDQFVSSYDLIQRSHMVMVYNSTIGLEATLLGKAVLTAGKARYTQIPTTFLPVSQDEYSYVLEEFLRLDEIEIPEEYMLNARRFLYTQLFLTSLPFNEYVREDGVWKGYVTPADFAAEALLPENSETIRVLTDGILHRREFRRVL